MVVLAVSTVLLGQSRARIDRERRAAESARARAQAINNFLVNDLLGQADPERNPAGADLTVRQLLDRAAKSLAAAESVALEPGVEGAVRSTIGNVYLELGLYREAVEQLSRAVNLLEQGGAPLEDIIFARNRAIWADAMRGNRLRRGGPGVQGERGSARPRAPRDRLRRGYLGAAQPEATPGR